MRIIQGTLPLSSLILSPFNARPSGRTPEQDKDIDGLAASIATAGLLQPIVVHAVKKPKGKYGVIAGGRRLAAITVLYNWMKLAEDRPDTDFDFDTIPVRIVEDASDAELVEASLTENFAREPMTDVQIYRAFKRVSETKGAEKQTDEQLADVFGVTIQRMRRIIRLAFVHPEIIDAYEAGKIRRESLFAYASSPDQDAQLRVFDGFDGSWQQDRVGEIRAALGTAGDRDHGDALRFVGIEAYEAAGGVLERDLFDDAASVIKNPELLEGLVAARLETIREEIRAQRPGIELTFQAEGPKEPGQGYTDYQLRVHPRAQPTAEQEQKLDALSAELEECDDEARAAELEEQIEALEEEIDRNPAILPDAATVVVMQPRGDTVDISYWYPDRKAAGLTERKPTPSSSTPKPAAAKVGEAAFDADEPPLTQRAADWLKAMRVNQAKRYVAGDSDRHRETARRAHRALIFALGHSMSRSYSTGRSIGLVHNATGADYPYYGTGLEPVTYTQPIGLAGKGLENPDPVEGWREFDAFMDDEQVDRLAAFVFAAKIEPSLTREVPTVADDVFTGLSHKPDARACAQPDMGLEFFKLWPKKVLGEFGQQIANTHKVAVLARKGDGPAQYLADMHGKAESGSPASAWLIKALRWLPFIPSEPRDARVAESEEQIDEAAE